VDKSKVKSYEAVASTEQRAATDPGDAAKVSERASEATQAEQADAGAVWIYLQGGAKVEADEVNETATGAWYRRDNLSIFIEKSRIERIERESAQSLAAKGSKRRWSERGWGTGSSRLDNLIRQNGSRFGVDPYFIFCVMEQESHFNFRAVSPMGAKGLMQLMPGTAARFGVRRPFDPAQNIAGGTRYLKMLLETHGGRIDLALASYNAGEGAVARYGGRVPPYRETRNYVRKISKQYDKIKPEAEAKTATDNGGATKMR
jgi:soluble lytic murein transglycosylase-like protein